MTTEKNNTIYFKIIAVVLAIIIICSLILQNLIQIKFVTDLYNDSTLNKTSADYLIENTEYFDQKELQRLETLAKAQGEEGVFETHYSRASIALSKNDNQTALEEIEKCLLLIDKDNEYYLDVLMQQGCLLALLENYQNALSVFDEILQIDKTNTQAMLLQAQLMIELGDANGAVEKMKTLFLTQEGDGEQLSIMAQLCYSANLFEDTIKYGKQAIEKYGSKTTDAELLRCMGYASLLALNNYQDAEKYLTNAILLLPKDGELYGYRGVSRLASGDISSALKDFDLSINNGNKTSAQYYNRGICYIAENEIEKATKDMQMVIQINDDSELTQIAKTILQELENLDKDDGGE